jgi:hypothetical protein
MRFLVITVQARRYGIARLARKRLSHIVRIA